MNYKRLLAVTAVAGMLAVTGCSSNIPARNQGNRNGQRVADAVNRRPDSYTGERTTRGIFGRNNTEDRNTRGFGGRYTRTPNRSNTFGRPASRAGSAFQRGANRNTARPLDENRANNVTSNAAIQNNTHTMNRTERGIPATNRATRRAADRVTGLSRANLDTAPVFFNKTKTAPEQTAPQQEQAPAPVQ